MLIADAARALGKSVDKFIPVAGKVRVRGGSFSHEVAISHQRGIYYLVDAMGEWP